VTIPASAIGASMMLTATPTDPPTGPIPAAGSAAPDVVATDLLLLWDGSRETFAVRWHLRTPVSRVDWLVATPTPATRVPLDPQALTQVAAAAVPLDRWYVTHPWLLVDGAGRRAREQLRAAASPGTDALPAARTVALSGRASALAAVPPGGGQPAVASRGGQPVGPDADRLSGWADAALEKGWSLQHVTLTLPVPATVVGPVALGFAADAPVLPPSGYPPTGAVTLLTVAPQVLAAEQPDLAAADSTTADATASAAPAVTDAPAFTAVPALTVENARALRELPGPLIGRASPSGSWVVTLLAGRTADVAPVILAPQGGPITDWRTQVGVWWPGWGPEAAAVGLGGLTMALLAFVLVGPARRRAARRRDQHARRPVVVVLDAAPAGADDPAPPSVVDTRPDLRPIR
jgi:hypothetical protein